MNLSARLTRLAIALGLSAASSAMAGLVALPQATFGGSGIPNTAVAVTQYHSLIGVDITLGLTATQRYSNPGVTNNTIDTFYAAPGGDAAHGQPGYALWNFDFYVGFSPQMSGLVWNGITGNSVSLFYDLNPGTAVGAGTGATIGGAISPAAFTSTDVVQNSWNLGMGFLSSGSFNPTALGEYDFKLVIKEAGNVVASSAIKVVVTNSPPAPSSVPDGGSTLALVGAALLGLAISQRRGRA